MQNCLRYFGLTDYDQIQRMSINEYMMRLEAYELKRDDEAELWHHRVWTQERLVSAADKKGKYVIKSFDDFYKRTKDDEQVARMHDELHRRRKALKKHPDRKGGN